LKESGAKVLLSACPLCELGLKYGINDSEKNKYTVSDISELLIKVI